MNKGVSILLQVVTVCMGMGILFVMIRFPQTEGRAVNLDLVSIYLDPFIIYIYIGSIALFVGLYQVCTFWGYIGSGALFSPSSANALRVVRYCAMTLLAFILGAVGYLFLLRRSVEEDIAGGVMMCLLLIVASLVVMTTATVLEKRIRHSFARNSQKKSILK